MNLTRRNHLNPCFWTALWNKNYYEKYISNHPDKDSPRTQLLNYLEINTLKQLYLPAENVHFEKDLGYGEITPTQMSEFIKRYFPENHEKYLLDFKSNPETLYIDFENHFTGFENTPAYKVLMKFIKNPKLEKDDKIWLTLFIQLHSLRSEIKADYEMNVSKYPGGKFEYFWVMKQKLQNPYSLLPETVKIANSKWTIYKSNSGDFPLSDVPIIKSKNLIIATLSPYLLAIINLSRHQDQETISIKRKLSLFTFFKYRKLVINNCLKGLIFLNRQTLNNWLQSREMKRLRSAQTKRK